MLLAALVCACGGDGGNGTARVAATRAAVRGGESSYAYDADGLPTQVAGQAVTRAAGELRVGDVVERFDAFGRVARVGDVPLHYGPDGQLAEAGEGAARVRYLHDESGRGGSPGQGRAPGQGHQRGHAGRVIRGHDRERLPRCARRRNSSRSWPGASA